MTREIDYSLYLVIGSAQCGARKLGSGTVPDPNIVCNLEDIVAAAVEGGVSVVQLREKNITTEMFAMTLRLKKFLSAHNVPLIINDHVEFAKAVDADGVHLGKTDMSCRGAQKILGKKKIIGVSLTSITDLNEVANLDVDYLGVGPVFPTQTKLDAEKPLELKQLKEINDLSHQKLVAIGGIQLENVAQVMATGVIGVAVVSAICAAECPKKASQNLLKVIKKFRSKLSF